MQIQKSNWFAEKNRKLRESGKKYYGRKKEDMWNYEIPKEPRKMGARCRCRQTENGTIKCSIITEEERKGLFKRFWSMTWPEKKTFIDSFVTAMPIKRPRERKDEKQSRRSQSLVYYLKKQEERIKVYRTMFINTLGVGRWTVINWKNKKSDVTNSCKAHSLSNFWC